MDNFHIYLTSEDSKEIYADNSFTDFTVELPLEQSFGDGRGWSFALTDIHLENKLGSSIREELVESIIVCCDLAKSSFIRSSLLPVLRYIPAGEQFGASLFQAYYVGLASNRVRRIRIYLLNRNLQPIDTSNWPHSNIILTCTLHFTRL